ncbi:hypothetical protein SAMN05428976_10260 [Clostridium sp. USBA 49]|uniref:hypothetical protein n=1 Tax=Clostridium sp. USBA 49 TaxID=1881060 RepID=UPI00099B1D95|nr:hypothetical protein [Clostridium sp. USBA 49]SKA75117.1 hypothetical protein SAMN05428976_10260 [Clostridium sp. USBA 49]
MKQQNKICNDDFDKDLYMAKTYWEPQLAQELFNKYGINTDITQGKVNWDLELDGQAFAELKCQKLKNVEGVWIKDKFYQNELMAAELTGLTGDKLGHFFHIPEKVKYYVIGLVSKYDEKHVEYFYWFDWQLYRQNIINILKHEYGSNWYELICNNKIWAVEKKNYKIIEQTQQNGGKKWILWLHNVWDLYSMDIQQWGLLKSHVKTPQILKNIA